MSKPLNTKEILTAYRKALRAARTLAKRGLDSGTLPASVRLQLELDKAGLLLMAGSVGGCMVAVEDAAAARAESRKRMVA